MMKNDGTIRAGFVGAGWMGTALLQRLVERPDVELAMLTEANPQRAAAVVKELGLSPRVLVDNYETIVGSPEIDAVFLCTPNAHHGPQSVAALSAGKHVFCEKPAATRFDNFRRQIELSRTNPELITFVDYILNFDPMEQRFHKMLADGFFGTISQIQINYRHTINVAGDKTWKLRRETVGDAIGMGIIHGISAMVTAMRPQALPVEVFATSNASSTMGYDVEPIWNIQVRFNNDAAGLCLGNIDRSNGYDAYHSVYGSEGAFVFDSLVDRDQQVRYWSSRHAEGKWIYPLDHTRCRSEGVEGFAWPADTTTPSSGNVIEHQTGACIEHFVDCIHSGRQSPFSFANSSPIAEIGWASMISAAERRPVPLPLDWDAAEKFFGG